MACRKKELREERKNRNAAAATSIAVGDALLFTTMCMIGAPVDVYAKDGSVCSGIFHTASYEKDYAIVLKKATLTKKGDLNANVVNGASIETLIVRSSDLVQVVAKGVQIPSNEIIDFVWRDDLEAAAGYTDADVVKPNDLKSRSRQVGDDSLEIQSDCHSDAEFQDKRTIDEAQGSSYSITSCEAQSTGTVDILEDTTRQEPNGVSYCCSSALEAQDQERPTSVKTALEAQDQERPTSIKTVSTVDSPSNISVASISNASSNTFLRVPPKISSVAGNAKESKLNPGAKTFSPSVPQHRTLVSSGSCPMTTPHEEIYASSFPRSSSTYKFTQYNNMAFGHSGNDAPHLQPIIGQLANRTQPVRYTGQYQNFQTGNGYVHPNPQNATGMVMFGQVSPLACMQMQPISNDVQHTAAGLYLATPHQVHIPKHQGNGSTQALPLLHMTPSFMANGPQQFVMSQHVFPVLRPMAMAGMNAFLSTKFA